MTTSKALLNLSKTNEFLKKQNINEKDINQFMAKSRNSIAKLKLKRFETIYILPQNTNTIAEPDKGIAVNSNMNRVKKSNENPKIDNIIKKDNYNNKIEENLEMLNRDCNFLCQLRLKKRVKKGLIYMHSLVYCIKKNLNSSPIEKEINTNEAFKNIRNSFLSPTVRRKNSQNLNFGMLKQILLLKENIDERKEKKKMTTQFSFKNRLKNTLMNGSSSSLVNIKKSLSKNSIKQSTTNINTSVSKKSSLFSKKNVNSNVDSGKSDNNLFEMKRSSRFGNISELREIKEERKVSEKKLKLIQLKSIENIENNHRVINSENNIIHTISSIYEEEKNDTNTFEIKSNTEIHLIKNLDNSKDSTKDVNTEKQLFEKKAYQQKV